MNERETAYQLGAHPPVNQNELLLLRAAAIQSYANLEQSLCSLFSALLGIKTDIAGIVFFRITNSGARNKILADLRKRKQPDQYNLFWNSVETFLRRMDQRRNEIVHWHTVQDIDLSKPHPEAARLNLRPPAGWMIGSKASLDEREMNQFITECNFISQTIGAFNIITLQGFDLPLVEQDPWQKSWLEIFQAPIVYPPPEGHPLSRTPGAL